MIKHASPDKTILGIMFFGAVGALSTAWVAQYGFDLFPCELCLYQRLPYLGIAVLSLLSLMPVVDTPSRRKAVQLGALLFLTTAGVAAYHVGVEQGWWQSSCAPTGVQSFSVSDIRSALSQPGTPACDDVPFTLFGISMAGYNLLGAVICASLAIWVTRKSAFWNEREGQ